VRAVVDAPPLDQVHWGILAVDLESGETLLSRNAKRKFIPASNMKVLVTAAALARLGPDHRFRTEIHAVGRLDPGTGRLDGDLVLVGTGDPSLSDRFWPDDEAPLRALGDSLVAAGIRAVDGSLVVDASTWDSTTVAGSWMVSDLPRSYSATGGAFAVAEGQTEVVIKGGVRPGSPADVTTHPRGERGFVISRVRTTEPPDTLGGEDPEEGAELDISYLPESRHLLVSGTVPAGVTDTLTLATRDPVRQATALLHRVLRERGVAIRDGARVAWEPGERVGPAESRCTTGGLPSCPAATRVAGLSSPPLSKIVQGVLEPSQNWMTEQLARSLGASDTTLAGWVAGLDAVESTLVGEVGVDSLDLVLRDGSGLSTHNLVTPRAMVAILRWAVEQPWGPAWREALAAPGEEGSTLRGRLEDLEGRLQGKTGTLSNVNSLSGYLVTGSGRTVVFGILTNGSGLPSSTVREGMDEVVRWLAAR
jgi:D-alanyl-D-alanine carboxypeptidase/D-alanyl-D-alanine-endopeptidase (penicillin-binding protein 4)